MSESGKKIHGHRNEEKNVFFSRLSSIQWNVIRDFFRLQLTSLFQNLRLKFSLIKLCPDVLKKVFFFPPLHAESLFSKVRERERERER